MAERKESARGEIKRVDVGFVGGQVLVLRTAPPAFESLVRALSDDKSPRWHEVKTEDSVVRVDLSQVIYVRRETEGHTVGF
jgi:hypothetical protein